MTNEGVVTKLLPNGMAEVAVTRATASGVMGRSKLKSKRSRSSVIFNAALLVYIMPLVFFIGGYALAYALGALEGVRIAVSFAFLAVSAVVLVVTQRSKKREPINFNIIEICEDGQND